MIVVLSVFRVIHRIYKKMLMFQSQTSLSGQDVMRNIKNSSRDMNVLRSQVFNGLLCEEETIFVGRKWYIIGKRWGDLTLKTSSTFFFYFLEFSRYVTDDNIYYSCQLFIAYLTYHFTCTVRVAFTSITIS